MKPSEPGKDQPSLAAYVEPSLPKPPAFSLCPRPHGSPEEVPSFSSCFPESFYYVFSPLKVSPYGKKIHMVLLPQSRTSPVSLSLEETLTLTGLAPCLSPHLATVSLFHFLPRPELSGLWAFIYIGPLAEDFLEIPASPAPGSTTCWLCYLTGAHYYGTNHPPLFQPDYMTVSLCGPSSGCPWWATVNHAALLSVPAGVQGSCCHLHSSFCAASL